MQTCHYEGGGERVRIRRNVHVVIFEASTGEQVDFEVFYGPDPDNCPGSLGSYSSSTGNIYSDDWPKSELEEFLSGYFLDDQD